MTLRDKVYTSTEWLPKGENRTINEETEVVKASDVADKNKEFNEILDVGIEAIKSDIFKDKDYKYTQEEVDEVLLNFMRITKEAHLESYGDFSSFLSNDKNGGEK